MLVIISDLHLTDGTSGTTIGANAFNIFRERLRDLAIAASDQNANGKEIYKPIEKIHLLLLGDILDAIRSTQWLQDGVRPWDDPTSKAFVEKVRDITHAILNHNQPAFTVFKGLRQPGGLAIPAAKPDNGAIVTVPVFTYYMVGNHDWFYHLPGPAFDDIRRSIIEALGLANDPAKVFPHDTKELDALKQVCEDHNVFARHGDIFDSTNYERPDRNRSSLGDAVVIQLVDRFAYEVKRQLGNKAPEGLEEIDNVRPLALIPTWVDGLLRRSGNSAEANQVRDIWNKVVSDFLEDRFVRQHHSSLKWGLRLSEGFSFRILGKLVPKAVNFVNSLGAIFPLLNKVLSRFLLSDNYYTYALSDNALRDDPNISYIVYGHTHRYELVPLRTGTPAGRTPELVYINSGTWRAVFDQARSSKDFFGYQVMAYLAFFKGNERKGKAFETWSGSLEYP